MRVAACMYTEWIVFYIVLLELERCYAMRRCVCIYIHTSVHHEMYKRLNLEASILVHQCVLIK